MAVLVAAIHGVPCCVKSWMVGRRRPWHGAGRGRRRPWHGAGRGLRRPWHGAGHGLRRPW